MIVAFTGHRPNKLGGYQVPNPTQLWICWRIREQLEQLKVNYALSGMALGVDQWAAKICVSMRIPFVAAVPFIGQEKMWPGASQREYAELLKKAEDMVVVCEGGYSVEKMQLRNQFMVDECDILIAVWDGTQGGTMNCVKYAEKQKRKVIRIIP